MAGGGDVSGTFQGTADFDPLACNVFATSAGRVPSAGNRYYLVVPSEGTVDGSYGVDGYGNERPPSAAACRPQSFDTCLP